MMIAGLGAPARMRQLSAADSEFTHDPVFSENRVM